MIYIVGIGPGNNKHQTTFATDCIEKSSVVIGASRQLAAITNFKGKQIQLPSKLSELPHLLREYQKEIVTVLASGDPMLYGIARFLLKQLPNEKIVVVPGISAVTYFFSKLQKDMNDIYITSSHGKVPDFDFVLMHEKVAMFTDSNIGPKEIAKEILKRGLTRKMAIGENLSYKEEKIQILSPEEVLEKENFQMNIVVIWDEK